MFRVLVIDDDENITLFISRLLTKKFNCKVETAYDGLEGLAKMKETNPEVIFLDVTMPVMDGLETLEAVKADSNFNEVPIIMLTAVSERTVIEKAMKMGVFDYMLKPLVYETTHERIREIFTTIRKHREKKKQQESDSQTSENGDSKILVVDEDPNFRKVFGKQLEGNHKVLEAQNGAEGLKIFMKERPKIVCVGENLPLLNERLLAQKIKTISKKTTVYAVRENIDVSEEEKQFYDMVIPKNRKIV